VNGRAVTHQSEGKMATGDHAATSKKKPEERDVEALLKANQVDVSKSEGKVWVWKVTPPVSKAWQTAFTKEEKEKEGGCMGSVFVTVDLLEGTKTVTGDILQDPTMPPEMIKSLKQSEVEEDKSSRHREITMELPKNGSQTTSDIYSLVHTDIPGSMYICTETSEGKVVIDGAVYQKYDAKPSLNRLRKYVDTSKGSGPKLKEYTGNDTHKPQMLKMAVPGRKNDPSLKSQPSQANKRVRMDPQMLQEILFNLFEKQPRYTLTELVNKTSQPLDFLKKSLDEICVKVKDGNKAFYEIKPEYKEDKDN